MKKHGFTLIELLITIAIIGILAGAATTAYIGVLKKAARSEAFTNLDALRLLQEAYFSDRAEYALSRANVDAIRNNELPGFRPDPNRSFDYATTQNFQLSGAGGNTTANPPGTVASPAGTRCFVAIATGITGTRVCPDGPGANCDRFAIDCNNNKNY
jgi:prepilin-type N-terminal cleavage/methylation domain-containing protein